MLGTAPMTQDTRTEPMKKSDLPGFGLKFCKKKKKD